MNLRTALAGGGGWLIGAAMIVGLFVGEQAQPVDTTVDVVAPSSPAAEETFNPCPPGWDFTEEADHVRILTCSQGGWVVSLNPDYTFNNGLNTNNPTAQNVTNPALVPGWPPR